MSKLTRPTSHRVTHKGSTVYDALEGTSFVKEVVMSLPFKFDGYDTALAELGGTYLYPQGACYDEEGNLFINHISSVFSQRRVVSVYSPEGDLLTWFYMPNSNLQSMSVTGKGVTRKVWTSRLSDTNAHLNYFDLQTLPVPGSEITTTTPVPEITGISGHITIRGNTLAYVDSSAAIGIRASEVAVNMFDMKSKKHKGAVYLSAMLVGFNTPTDNKYYYDTWKIQGLALGDGKLYVAIGGSYRPKVVPTVDKAENAVHDFGVVEVALDGTILSHSVVRADTLMTGLSSAGYPVDRTESEGCFISPNGEIHHLMVGDDLVNRTDNGYVVMREFSESGIDMTDGASSYVPMSREQLSRVYRSRGGLLNNPWTGSAFASISEILDFMSYQNLPEFTWLSTVAPTLAPINGFMYEQNMLYTIYNANNGGFVIKGSASSGAVHGVEHFATGTLGNWSATMASNLVSKMVINGVARITAKAANGKETLLMFQNNTGSTSPLVIGGGTSGMQSANSISFYIDPVANSTSGGVNKMQLNNTGLYPSTSGGITLGTASLPWGQFYTTLNPIVSSDVNLKKDIQPIPAALLDVWGDLDFKMYQFKDPDVYGGKTHFGVIAQDIIDVFRLAGLDAHEFGVVSLSEEGVYGVNYEQILCIESAYIRRRIGR